MDSRHRPIERSFNLDGFHIAAQEWGQKGDMPIIALHGWLDNSASFHRLLSNISGFHVLAIDLAGHGQSDHRQGATRYTIWQDIPDIFAIADEMGWQDFGLLGHSRGAMIALLAAGTFPARITCVGLIEGLWPEPAAVANSPQQLAKSIRHYQRQKSAKLSCFSSIEAAIDARQGGRFPLSYDAAKVLVERGTKRVEGGYIWSSDPCLLMASPFKLTAEHIQAFVARIKAPMLLIAAEQGMKDTLDSCREQVDKISNLRVAVLAGGHHLHMESESDKVAELLLEFFESF